MALSQRYSFLDHSNDCLALDTISEDLLWVLVVVGVIAAIAVVSLLRQ
jgi:hypothetical protein